MALRWRERARLPWCIACRSRKGVIVPSPVKDNVLDPIAFARAVANLVPAGTRRSEPHRRPDSAR